MSCGLLSIQEWIYILSLAFQIAGAVLLIIKYCYNTKNRIIEEYFPGTNIAERDKNGNIKLEKKEVQKCAKIIYDNRAAFFFIAVGYILSIFGNIESQSKIYVLVFVVVFTVIIIALEKGVINFIAKISYKNDIIIPYEDVEDRVDTIMTNEEIDKLFDS